MDLMHYHKQWAKQLVNILGNLKAYFHLFFMILYHSSRSMIKITNQKGVWTSASFELQT